MTFNKSGPTLLFVLEGVPFLVGESAERREYQAKGAGCHPKFHSPNIEETHPIVPVVLLRHRRPAPETCREQL